MKPILEIQNISKKYKLRGQEMPYLTIREAITGKNKQRKSNEFWALKDIIFDVYPGESIGIIGKNGAGKSTLLKILSKITPPTKGKIIARGRIASLLEVGTGFHPELTGIENIFLNGSILGLKKVEIKKKIDEIIDFAGVEKFIDTPLKHYSSGMQLRLAFAVAAHLEPEILIIDEVLAVGDAEFQKKSLNKMEDVTKQGRTVIFVSHNMAAVKSICESAILLENGGIAQKGNSSDVIRTYLNWNFISKNIWFGDEGNEEVRLLRTECKAKGDGFFTDVDIEIKIKIKIIQDVTNLVLGFHLKSEYNDMLAYTLYDDYFSNPADEIKIGIYEKRFIIPAYTLSKGSYYIEIDLGIHNAYYITKGVGDLTFSLLNRTNLGARFPVVDSRGYSSLFRPNWHIGTIL